MSDSHYRFAVLGAVKHDYLPRAVAAHPRCSLVVVADDADQPLWVHQRNQQFADEHRIPYIRDVNSALADFDVRAVVVSSQVDRHCDLSRRAAARGLHVIQDKPLGVSLAECEALVKEVEQRGVKFLMWNRNFMPALLAAREQLAAGAIGALRALHVDFYFAKDAGPHKNAGPPNGDGAYERTWLEHQIAAHADGSDGGLAEQPLGELAIEGVYPLAFLTMLAGVKVLSVFARTASHFHQLYADNGVDDLASLSLELEGGLLATICLGRIGRASHPNLGEIKLHLIGERGALIFDEPRPEVSIHYRGQPPGQMPGRRLAVDNDYLLVEDFLQAIENDRDTVLDARASRDIAAVVDAALESARTGKASGVR